MAPPAGIENEDDAWVPLPDPPERYSSGIADFDRILGGGFRTGSLVVYGVDETVDTSDLDLMLFPTILNFLYQSRGMIAVLPGRDSPHKFRSRLIAFASRRRFDSRVRLVDYVGEDEEAPYVVRLHLPSVAARPKDRGKHREADLGKMVAAEKAAQGLRQRPFLELNAFEVIDTAIGSETAGKMVFHGIKRAQQVGNLVLGLVGPGVGCAPAVRRLAEMEFALRREPMGLTVRGIRPEFPAHLVVPDPLQGLPHVNFVPKPA